MYTKLIKLSVAALALSFAVAASAQPARRAPEVMPNFAPTPAAVQNATSPKLEDYFTPVYPATKSKSKKPVEVAPATPDKDGFIRRWSLLEPIAKPELRSNDMFTDSWLREEFATEHFPGQQTIVPTDGQKVKLDKKTSLTWHCYDSKRWNVKLYRFATGLGLRPTEGKFYAVTVINCDQDMTVRMAVGSNSGSMWWVNGEEALLLANDRRMVVDDVVSKKITLHKGKNVVRGVVINGPGMSDFCLRFLDLNGKPVTNLKVSNQ